MTGSREIFDVVNEKNEVIGQTERREVHRKGLWHRAVRILIFNSKGELLLQKRKKSTDLNPGVWSSSAAGHLNAGENYLHAAKRELGDELGIEMRLQKLGSEKVDLPNDRTFAKYYIGKCDSGFKTWGGEASEVKFFPIRKIRKMVKEYPEKFSPNFLKLFEMYLKTKKMGSNHAKR